MSWYLAALKKYASFSGRARRKEYWMFYLVSSMIYIAIGFAVPFLSESSVLVIFPVYGLAMLLPSLAVLVRRLHDTGHSGWWFFISLLPVIGGIVLLVFLCQDSHEEENQYGSNPKMDEGYLAVNPA
jgi:uncharacterized membrane protein YhaH (DUF805 family)